MPARNYKAIKIAIYRGVSRIFERGGPISLSSLKKGHQILKGGGVQWSDGGQYIRLTRTTNLAYLDAKE